jgi:hypothetical protein
MKPHQHSDKTPEQLAAQREHRLRARIARAYEKSGIVDKALGLAGDILDDPDVAKRTKGRIIQSVLANANRAAQGPGTTQIDARVGVFTAQDFLRLATTPAQQPLGTTGRGDALPTPSNSPSDTLLTGPSECRSPEAGVTGASEPDDGPPARVRSEEAPTPPAGPVGAPVPAETVGDGTTLRCPACGDRSGDEQHACPMQPEV